MVLSLLAAAVLSADPGYSVVVARRIGFEPGQAREFAESLAKAIELERGDRLGPLRPVGEVSSALSKAGFPDTSVCNGATACVSSLARLSGLPYLVSLQVVKVGSSVALDASVVDSGSGKSLSVVTRTLKVKDLGDALPALAAALLAPLPRFELVAQAPDTGPPPEPPLVTGDAPKEVTLVPAPKEPPPEVVATPALPTGRKVALGLGGAAVVAVGVAIALGVSASAQSNALSSRDPDYAQKVQAVQQTALTADVLYVASALLAGGAAATWFLTPATPPAR